MPTTVADTQESRTRILTDIPGTPGMFWGDHSAYAGSFQPPRWLVRSLGKARAYDAMGALSALRLLARRRHHPGVVTDGGTSGLLFATLQALIPFGRKPHVLIDCLWYESDSRLLMAAKRAVRRLAARSKARFVVWASHEVEDYARVFGIPRERFLYVPHYYSLDGYTFEVRDDGYLFAGGNGDRDYRTLIEAVRPLGLPTWIATTNAELTRGVVLPAHVRVKGTDHAGFRQAMAASSMVVVPLEAGLLHSGGQQTCLNAMKMGKPTIAVGRRWAADLIDDGVDGLIVDYGDIAGLRAAIRRLLNNPEAARAMGRAASRKAEQFPSARAMRTIYEVILSDHG